MTAIRTPWGALSESNFRLFSLGSFLSMMGRQMLTVGIGWDIYEKTNSAMALGYIGLVQLLPVILLTLPAGHVVDSYDRRKVLLLAQGLNATATLGLLLLALWGGHVWSMYACLLIVGIGRAFHSPANAALLPQVVSETQFTSAVSWGSIIFQGAAVLGPALAGLLIGIFKSAIPVYLCDFLGCAIFALFLLMVKVRPIALAKRAMTWSAMVSGLSFVWQTRIILAAITLDMFAVLFGGSVALLPIFAKDILHAGPSGLGWLQTAPSVGAILMGFFLARAGHFRQAGKWLLYSIIGFGVATIGFGLSQNLELSYFMLFLTGICDNVSVVIRQALVQLRTPDAMRGRVSAINYVFIGTSNELGGFESGLAAHFLGPIPAVVLGGVATIVTVILTALFWPELRQLDRLQEPASVPLPADATAG